MAAFSVTEALVSWLGKLGYRASSRAPASPEGPFVTVERVGGGVSGMVDRASVAVQAWAESEEVAEALACSVRLDLLTRRPPAGIHGIRAEAGPYAFYDEATRRPRYQTVLAVSCQLETED